MFCLGFVSRRNQALSELQEQESDAQSADQMRGEGGEENQDEKRGEFMYWHPRTGLSRLDLGPRG